MVTELSAHARTARIEMEYCDKIHAYVLRYPWKTFSIVTSVLLGVFDNWP